MKSHVELRSDLDANKAAVREALAKKLDALKREKVAAETAATEKQAELERAFEAEHRARVDALGARYSKVLAQAWRDWVDEPTRGIARTFMDLFGKLSMEAKHEIGAEVDPWFLADPFVNARIAKAPELANIFGTTWGPGDGFLARVYGLRDSCEAQNLAGVELNLRSIEEVMHGLCVQVEGQAPSEVALRRWNTSAGVPCSRERSRRLTEFDDAHTKAEAARRQEEGDARRGPLPNATIISAT